MAIYTNPEDNNGIKPCRNGSAVSCTYPSWTQHAASWFIEAVADFLAANESTAMVKSGNIVDTGVAGTNNNGDTGVLARPDC